MPDDIETCLGCGCEPDKEQTIVAEGKEIGYRCSCNAVVVDGYIQGTTYARRT